RWIADQGVHGVAVNVDTGEGPHLYPDERLRVIEIAAEEVGDRMVVVAGLAGAFTDQATRLAADSGSAGAQALLVFPLPAYQGEPLDPRIPARYHQAVGDACGLPLIAFQLQPALGGVNFSRQALEQLLAVEYVAALKEASFDAKRFVDTVAVVGSLQRDIVLLNGNDNFLLEAYLLGAGGALLGFGSLAASEQVAMLDAARRRDLDAAYALRPRLQALCDTIFAPPVRDYRARVKYALKLLGVIGAEHMRPPLLPLSEAEQQNVKAALARAELL
ncbi:MAG: dihydrodipicolinate synthase family protein, partial [Micromonosporaceae bacterium]